MSNYLVLEFWNASPHIETGAEIASMLKASGRTVHFGCWGSYFTSTEIYAANSTEDHIISQLLNASIMQVKRPAFTSDDFDNIEFNPLDLYQLRLKTYKNSPAGEVLYSYLIDQSRNPRPPLDNPQLISRLFREYVAIYESTSLALRELGVSCLVLFNGRFFGPSAARYAARSLGVKCLFHERGSSQNKYFVFREPVQSMQEFWRQLDNVWTTKICSDAKALIAGKSYLNEREQGDTRNWPSFTSQQTEETLSHASRQSHIISFFTSSADEYEAIYDRSLYPDMLLRDELSLVCYLLNLAIKNPSYQIYIRMHPNLSNKNSDSAALLLELDASLPSNLTVIGPSSAISTYALIKASDRVLSFGSTCTIEAAGYGIASATLAASAYSNLPSIFKPSCLTDLTTFLSRNFVVDSDLLRYDSFKYFYCYYNMGINYSYYKPTSLFSGLFSL